MAGPAALTQQATRHARRVYVGGLPPPATEASIATFFSQAMAAARLTYLSNICTHKYICHMCATGAHTSYIACVRRSPVTEWGARAAARKPPASAATGHRRASLRSAAPVPYAPPAPSVPSVSLVPSRQKHCGCKSRASIHPPPPLLRNPLRSGATATGRATRL